MPKKAEKQIKRQGGTARYRTIKSGDKTLTCAITRKEGPRGGKTICWPKKKHRSESVERIKAMIVLLDERDDLNKLPITAQSKAYARRHGLAAMRRQPQQYISMIAAETGQSTEALVWQRRGLNPQIPDNSVALPIPPRCRF